MSMVDLRYKEAALWKLSATPAERSEVDRIDDKTLALKAKLKELSGRRYAITNRCTVRTLGRRESNNG